jgi:hypothetical protein
MPILTNATGIIRPLAGGGRPLVTSGGNIAAPPIVTPPSDLTFNMATAKPGVPGVNDQFENYGKAREWAFCFNHPTEGFAGIRWQPTWKRADGYYGSWEPAEGEIFRVHRKGASGADLRTLVLTCGPNPAAIPAGESVVLWDVPSNGGVSKSITSLNLSGFNLPLMSKLTVAASTGSAAYDVNGRRLIEIAFGQDLPAIDYTVPTFSENNTTWRRLRHRHWSFYKNTATKALRHPIGWFTGITLDNVLKNGGYSMLGGVQHLPTWYDWTQDYRMFGASLTEELWRSECNGLAERFGNTDPRFLAVELENEPTRPWRGTVDNPGYGDLLPDVWYGIARQIWGQERTLVVKSTGFGTMDSLRDEFDFRCPTGENAHLVTHNYDGQAHQAPNNNIAINWANMSQTDYYAKIVADKVSALGYKGGGMTEMGSYPFEWWDYNIKVSQEERARRMGRLLTSMTNKGLHVWFWGHLSGDPTQSLDMAAIYTLDGHNIETVRPVMRPFMSRAGLTVT